MGEKSPPNNDGFENETAILEISLDYHRLDRQAWFQNPIDVEFLFGLMESARHWSRSLGASWVYGRRRCRWKREWSSVFMGLLSGVWLDNGLSQFQTPPAWPDCTSSTFVFNEKVSSLFFMRRFSWSDSKNQWLNGLCQHIVLKMVV